MSGHASGLACGGGAHQLRGTSAGHVGYLTGRLSVSHRDAVEARKTWSDPKPTTLVHPDAPPMLFHLADGKTLIAFHHNRHGGGNFNHRDRSEVWFSTSTDEGQTWTEPRLVLANALAESFDRPFRNY